MGLPYAPVVSQTPPSKPIRVLLVDDHPSVLDGVGIAIEQAPDLLLVGTARTADAAADAIGRLDVDVVVQDVELDGKAEGLRLVERYARCGRPAFVMLTAYDYPTLVRAAWDRGASGYLLKTAELGAVVAAVRRAARGERVFPSGSTRALSAVPRRPSDRELEVLRLLAGGMSNEDIARELFLSLKTVESHLRRLFDRYGLMNRTELAVLALREGWVDPGPPR
jgi:DNA-binding NarL/FixJ family response regulator